MTTQSQITRVLELMLRELQQKHLGEVVALQRQLTRANALVKLSRKQRDAAKGRAAEYKTYANKYQRELLLTRKELADCRNVELHASTPLSRE